MFKTCFPTAENTSYQPPTGAGTPKIPAGVKVVKCPAGSVTFSAVNLFFKTPVSWNSVAMLILAIYIDLTEYCVAGLQVGNDGQLQTQILFQNV